MHFLSLGYHACVLQYSVSQEAFYPTQLLEVRESVRQIHEHAKEWYIDTKKIVLAGASAGGHLAANYCAFWKREFLVEKSGMQREMLKPRGLILCYPVITSKDPGVCARRQASRRRICWATRYEAERLEKLIPGTSECERPRRPVFSGTPLRTDPTVPLPNSLLLARSPMHSRPCAGGASHVYPGRESTASALADELVQQS